MADSGTTQPGTLERVPNGGICYVFGIAFPVYYLLFVRKTRQSPFLRFHSFQSLMVYGPLCVILLAEDRIAWRSPGEAFIALLLTISWIVCIIQAGRRKRFHIPIVGRIAEWLAAL